MQTKDKLKPLAAAMGAALTATVMGMSTGQASENPFGMTKLSGGYMVADAHKGAEGKCGEGKCGASKAKEGKCGEGKCGADKAKEGKCGEGKCGAAK